MEASGYAPPSEDRTHFVAGIGIFCIVLEAIALTVRFISRYLSEAGFWWDDWLVLSAWPLIIGVHVCLILEAAHGMGKHVWAAPDGVAYFFKILYFQEIIYNLGVAMVKLSILLFYRRIFPQRSFKYALYGVALIIVTWATISNFISIFQCSPIPRTWNPRIPGKCINSIVFFLSQCAQNTSTDLIVLLLPLPLIWKLQVPKSQKVALIGVFSLGGSVVAMSIIRLVTFTRIDPMSRDVTWTSMPICIWSSIEPCFGIVSACLPSMVYLFRKVIAYMTPSSKVSASAGSGVRTLPETWTRRGMNKGEFVQLGDGASRTTEFNSALNPEHEMREFGQEQETPHSGIRVRQDVDLKYV